MLFEEQINDISLLYVEDNDEIFDSFEKFFKNRFSSAYFAKSGLEGLKAYNLHHPDIIVTDIKMPNLDGLLMLQEIKKQDRELNAIVTSAFNDTEYLHKAIELGVHRYVLKPIKKAQLEAALSDMIERIRLRRLHENYTHELERRVEEETQKRVEQERLLMQQSRFVILGEMIGSISHQLKQPLSIMSITAENIEDVIDNIEGIERYKPLKEQFMRSITYMTDTINVFRNFLKPQEEKRNFDIYQALYDIFLLTSKMLTSSSIYWSIQTKNGAFSRLDELKKHSFTLSRADGDPNEFKQILMNLIANSRDAIIERQKEKRGDGKILIDIKDDEEFFEIRFEDNGGGIGDDMFKHLFEPYFSTKGEKGTGIGLYMCRQITEKMGGSINAENTENGASFIIKLKRYKQ